MSNILSRTIILSSFVFGSIHLISVSLSNINKISILNDTQSPIKKINLVPILFINYIIFVSSGISFFYSVSKLIK